MKGKRLGFQASISDITPINPLFSTCKVRVMYTGKNPNNSIITREAVEKALPTIKNIPIVGEFSEENNDFKGHGGAIDLTTMKYIHTTKPYGVVPESVQITWEPVTGSDGVTREYLTLHGCYLWTGRYEEAQSVIENGKGQSMEIEVIDGQWVPEENAFQIDDFVFSALCILGDNVQPAFPDACITAEDANVTADDNGVDDTGVDDTGITAGDPSIIAYSLDKESFKKEFAQMLRELQFSLSKEKEVQALDKLLKKYSITVEDLKAKGIDFENLSEEELEAKIKEAFEVKDLEAPEVDAGGEDKKEAQDYEQKDAKSEEPPVDDVGAKDAKSNKTGEDFSAQQPFVESKDEPKTNEYTLRIAQLEDELKELKGKYQALLEEVEDLRSFKLEAEKAEREAKAKEIFEKFQLTEEDIQGIDIYSLTFEEIEEKCYAILGRKLVANKFTLNKEKDTGIRLPISGSESRREKQNKPYGDLFERYKNK